MDFNAVVLDEFTKLSNIRAINHKTKNFNYFLK